MKYKLSYYLTHIWCSLFGHKYKYYLCLGFENQKTQIRVCVNCDEVSYLTIQPIKKNTYMWMDCIQRTEKGATDFF
jgi:hypothetical protein